MKILKKELYDDHKYEQHGAAVYIVENTMFFDRAVRWYFARICSSEITLTVKQSQKLDKLRFPITDLEFESLSYIYRANG